MAEIFIKFRGIKVFTPGDREGTEGEIYYTFFVNDMIAADRGENQAISVNAGDTIDVETGLSLTNMQPGQTFKVSGYVKEDDPDHSFDSDDEAGEFEQYFQLIDRNGSLVILGPDHTLSSGGGSQKLNRDGVSVEIEWDFRITPDRVPDFGTLNTEQGLKGIAVFEDWRFNRESPRPRDGAGAFGEGVYSQTFGLGDHVLPVPYSLSIRSHGIEIPVYHPGVRPGRISSVKVGDGYWAELFKSADFTGRPLELRETADVMPEGWNDQIKSIRVHPR